MAKIVIAFESQYGQSHKIAEHIADRARRAGHAARLVRASVASHAILDDADGFIVVAPVYFGRHQRDLRRFLRTYGGTLERRPLAFVSVCNSAAQASAEAQAEATRIAHRTVDEAALRPVVVVTAGGALAYPRYGFLIRQVMRMIAKKTGMSTDTRKIHELTNWEVLDRELEPFFAMPAIDLGNDDRSGIHSRGNNGVTAPSP